MIDEEEIKMSRFLEIDKNSSWFSGHFPDNPILPGIAQLKMIVDLISSACNKNLYMTGLSRVKFRKIIGPGDRLNINVSCANQNNQYTFRITSGSENVCSGKIFFSN